MNDQLTTASYLTNRLLHDEPTQVWNWVRRYNVTREQVKTLMNDPAQVANMIANDIDPKDDWTEYAAQADWRGGDNDE